MSQSRKEHIENFLYHGGLEIRNILFSRVKNFDSLIAIFRKEDIENLDLEVLKCIVYAALSSSSQVNLDSFDCECRSLSGCYCFEYKEDMFGTCIDYFMYYFGNLMKRDLYRDDALKYYNEVKILLDEVRKNEQEFGEC